MYHYLLALFGAAYYGFPSRRIKVIGVTGTKGKSSTTEFLNAIFEAAGKKTALGIMNAAPVEMIVSAVMEGDSSHLVKVSGIGAKNAQKIILELKGKVDGFRTEMTPGEKDTDALDALQTLGYTLKEARETLKKSPPNSRVRGRK